VFLGRLDPARYLGGDVAVDPGLSERAIDRLARRLELSTPEAASGILRIANANMTSATHLVSVERGHDPRDFTLVAGGGAGPLHAVEVARELGIPRVVVPRAPGLTSALGILAVDLRHDLQRSVLKRAEELDPHSLATIFDDLVEEANRLLDAEDVPAERRALELSIDVRYYGQTPYMTLPVAGPPQTTGDLEDILRDYETRYLREFGYLLPRSFASVEFVNARVAAIGVTSEIKLPRSNECAQAATAVIGSRPVYFDEAGDFVESILYERTQLANGAEIEGPAIVEQTDTTVVLPPGAAGRIDDALNIVISVNGG
jgi:N-methylhydantoinase A